MPLCFYDRIFAAQHWLIQNLLSHYVYHLSTNADGTIPGCLNDIMGPHQYTPKGRSSPVIFNVTRGDYSRLMALLVENIEKAKVHFAVRALRNGILSNWNSHF